MAKARKVTELQGYRVTRLQSCKVTRLQPQRIIHHGRHGNAACGGRFAPGRGMGSSPRLQAFGRGSHVRPLLWSRRRTSRHGNRSAATRNGSRPPFEEEGTQSLANFMESDWLIRWIPCFRDEEPPTFSFSAFHEPARKLKCSEAQMPRCSIAQMLPVAVESGNGWYVSGRGSPKRP